MKVEQHPKNQYSFFDRDLSWLSFNARLLQEAKDDEVPLMERIRFLAIYSSNLNEFYRVRMPGLQTVLDLSNKNEKNQAIPIAQIIECIYHHQEDFGRIIQDQILPNLLKNKIKLLYNIAIPSSITKTCQEFFITNVAMNLHIVAMVPEVEFFPENNKLYMMVCIKNQKGNYEIFLLTIPSDQTNRFFSIFQNSEQYIVFLEDIIKLNLPLVFHHSKIISSHSFKITRNADLDLKDELEGNLAKKIESKIVKREKGFATRCLYEPGIPEDILKLMRQKFNLKKANFMEGGTYHNLNDLSTLPIKNETLYYPSWNRSAISIDLLRLFEEISYRDIILHPPYQFYDAILAFFSIAAIDPFVTKIYATLYRISADSKIAKALITASKNGKKVTVFVELKARFDEANNIQWAKKMSAAGVKVIYSIPGLKVHAKIAVVVRKKENKREQYGLLSTGNFNEDTAKYYTDHILLTANNTIVTEMETLFHFLLNKNLHGIRSDSFKDSFKVLLVAQFNLLQQFLFMIDREIANAKKGLASSITIKMNNLEERQLISKLYEASNAGVIITLVIRGICCLIPGVKGMSENIVVRRIIDRYLEHGRIFVFGNGGVNDVYLGSSDWMNRNIYHRIEVCFPILDANIKSEVLSILDLQAHDNTKAVELDDQINNTSINPSKEEIKIRSQMSIGQMLAKNIAGK